MTLPPRSAIILASLGLIPFLWGALTTLLPDLALSASATLGPRFVGPYVQLAYGAMILAFMSGALWGFATRATGKTAALAYCLSTVPALWVFFMVGGGPVAASMNLIFGFLGLLMLDFTFAKLRLAPDWWMTLRIPLTAIVVACLLTGAL